MRKLHQALPSLGWIPFRLAQDRDTDQGPRLRTSFSPPETEAEDGQAKGPADFTSVMTRLGPDDLATVDTLIAAGIASSRAEVPRWALGRIREHPAHAQLQDRVREISELKAQF